MKSYIFKITTLLLFFSFISCSDSSEDDGRYTLVGDWSRSMYLVNGVNVLNDCEARDIINFESDGTYVGTYYYEDTTGECELDDIENGTWELISKRLIFNDDFGVNLEFIDNNKIHITQEGSNPEDIIEVWVRI